MSKLEQNIIYFVLVGCFVIYFTVYPVQSELVNETLIPGAIMFLISIIAFGFDEIMKNWRRLWLFLITKTWYRNTSIRLSISYLYRIKINDKYLLVKSNHDGNWQPVGGVYKTLPGSEKIFEELNVQPDRVFETEKGIAKCDLRVHVNGKNVIPFLRWFDSGEDRELSPWREFCEELITTTNILKADNFRYINYKYKGRVTSPIIRLDVGGYGYFQYDIFDLVPNDAQTKELEVLYGSGDGETYRWFTAEQIKAQGYDQRTKKFIANILRHSKYSLEIKWSK